MTQFIFKIHFRWIYEVVPKGDFHSVEEEDKITLNGILEESKDMALICPCPCNTGQVLELDLS